MFRHPITGQIDWPVVYFYGGITAVILLLVALCIYLDCKDRP